MAPDLASATRYALERLDRELPPERCYHSIGHTRDDVAVMTARLAALSNLTGMGLLLLQTAAYYHDIGFVASHVDHEEAGVAIAALTLPAFGYSPAHIRRVAALIRATRLPQRPRSLPARIIADADLDVLGRDDFMARNQALRRELASYGKLFSDEAWYSQQLSFLQRHRYWTAAARDLRDATKRRNAEQIAALLARARAETRS